MGPIPTVDQLERSPRSVLTSLLKSAERAIGDLGYRLQRFRYSLRRQGFSHSNEERILKEYINQLLPLDHPRTVVDIGAGDGVRWSNSYSLFLSGWKGTGIEADDGKFVRLKRAYQHLPNAHAYHGRASPDTIVPILESLGVERDLSVLSLDIDGNDYWVLEAILSAFRPSLIVTEINEKIPPPIRFVVKYDPNFSLRHHFYGYSISALMDLCKRYDYGLLELEYNNAFIAPAEIGGRRFIDAETAYGRGYRDRADRKKRFPQNFEMEALFGMTPDEGLKFIREFFAREVGNYHASLSPLYDPVV